MFGQNVNNDFYSTLNKTICNLTECEGHTMLEYTILRGKYRDYLQIVINATPTVRINKAIIILIMKLNNELCVICFISILLQFPRARYRSFYCFMQFTEGNWPINQK